MSYPHGYPQKNMSYPQKFNSYPHKNTSYPHNLFLIFFDFYQFLSN